MNGRDRFAVGWMALLYFFSWFMSLGRLIGIRFWDKQYVIENILVGVDKTTGIELGFSEATKSYYSDRRYIYFLPHVFGAIFWWNLYFLQLVPSIRRKYKWFHRYLGRFLMITLLLQIGSGVGLAATNDSNIIKITSFALAIATFYTLFQAFYYAWYRDIPKHKYWVIRLVGYMQTIALQRFWMFLLIVSYQCGWYGLYPKLDNTATKEQATKIAMQMFDDSFILCIFHAVFMTEWYLAGQQGMLEMPASNIGIQNKILTKQEKATQEGYKLIPDVSPEKQNCQENGNNS